MKKILLILLAFSAITTVSNSQDITGMEGINRGTEPGADYRDLLQLGVKLGANYSNVYDASGEEFKANGKFGLATGVFIALPIGKILGFQPEILISQKGFQATGRILGNDYEFTRTTTYVDIPLLISIKPNKYVNLLAGPQYSYLVKQKDVFSSPIMNIEQEAEFNNDNLRKNTLCFLGGMDFNLSHFVLGVRVGWDIFNNTGDGSSTSPRYKNTWYQATVGYRLFNN